MPKKHVYNREELIDICVDALVPEKKWCNRDTEQAQRQIGEVWALLRAGCKFGVILHDDLLQTNERTIWVKIWSSGFSYFEGADR